MIGPDPDQPAPDGPRPFGIDELTGPRLVTWAARVDDLSAVVRRARAAGHDPGQIIAMSRESPDGARLHWRMALPPAGGTLGGLMPLLIDWADAVHPSQTAAPGMTLLSLTGFHPDVARVERYLAALGEQLDVRQRPEPGLRALLATPAGEVALQ